MAQCTLKNLERLINNRIYRWLERDQKLPNSQFGFRNKRSCFDNVSILTLDTLYNWYDNKDTILSS